MADEALNVHFYEGGLGTKRGGTEGYGWSGGSPPGSVHDLVSWVPGQDPAARELFVFTAGISPGSIYRLAASADTTTAVTCAHGTLSGIRRASCAAINGKLVIATGLGRPKVFDPTYSTTATRNLGIGTPAAATVANTGAGSYAATLRYYRVAFTYQVSSVTVGRGELGTSVSFTPSGSGTHARITKPTTEDHATHWEVYGSADNVTYYGPIGTIAVGTTTYDDNATVTTYATTYDLAPTEGTNKPFPGTKYLYSNGSRLFGFGLPANTDTDTITVTAGTVYFSPALDSSSIHDEERCQDTVSAVGKVVLARNAGGVDRGIAGLGNLVIAFQSQGIYALIPTENPDTPFRRVQYSNSIGAVSHQSIIEAEDELGRPCIYFLDPIKGPYRLGQDGLKWVGKDVYDIWSTAVLGTSSTVFYPHGVYYAAKRQVWFWVNKDAASSPNCILCLDIQEQSPDEDGHIRGGWSQWDGTISTRTASCMFSNTPGTSMSTDLKPYIGYPLASTLSKCDVVTAGLGDSVQAYIQSGGLNLAPIRNGITRSHLLAEASSAPPEGVTITQTFVRNFGDETNRTDTVNLAPSGSETHVLKAFDASSLQDAFIFQVRLGDASASTGQWTFESWWAHVDQNEDI